MTLCSLGLGQSFKEVSQMLLLPMHAEGRRCLYMLLVFAFCFVLQATKLTLVDGIRSNTNMASALCSYHVNAGSWKKLLSDLEQVDQLTAADVQAVAAATFQEDNLYTGYMLKEDPLTGKKSSTV